MGRAPSGCDRGLTRARSPLAPVAPSPVALLAPSPVALLALLEFLVLLALLALAGWAPVAVASQPKGPTVTVVQTNAYLSERMRPMPSRHFAAAIPHGVPRGVPVISVEDSARYQRFAGIGAAMTDSSAWLLYEELPPLTRATVFADLFGPAGIHLGFIRVPVGASDYTIGAPYSYDDLPPGESDLTLSSFSIAHDQTYVIPALREALQLNPQALVLASPWSPPAWMKTNAALGDPDSTGTLLTGDYPLLAAYLVKFIQAYAAQGIAISAITPENEPATQTAYPGLDLPEPQEASFVVNELRPALQAAGLTVGIFGYDAGWDVLSVPSALASGEAAHALSGIAWHCYFGSPTVMSQVHAIAPWLEQIVDECSPEIRPFSTSELLISSLRDWASAVAGWNLALDPTGGPVQAPNSGCLGCTGVVTINEQTQAVTLSAKYFQLGQVSAFVMPGATRIQSNNFVSYGVNSGNMLTVSPGLDDVAFLNPNGIRVLIVYNNATHPMRFAVRWRGRAFLYRSWPGTTTTFEWR